mmetsp:Transcript_42514/g.77159  ORF Transcript_42514/g.77159 Transcript_42514/m.77159 type:complete len:524 (+) Transcript_42514:83-1654(+)
MSAFVTLTKPLGTSLIVQASSRARDLPGTGTSTASPAAHQIPSRCSTWSLLCHAAAGVTIAAHLRGGRRQRAGRRVPQRAFEYELGVQAPVGYWDPLGLAADGDLKDFRQRREVELKHGRVAMYATIGYIVPEFFKFPGYVSITEELEFANVPNGLAACDVVPIEGWLQIIAYCGYLEIVVNQPMNPKEPGNYYRGRFGANPLRIMADEDLRKRSLNAELANGRLAMVAIIGMFFQDGLTGQAWGDWALYTDSPLRAEGDSAFVNEAILAQSDRRQRSLQRVTRFAEVAEVETPVDFGYDKQEEYNLEDGLSLLMKMHEACTTSNDHGVVVNMHMNLNAKYPDQQIRTAIKLPNGTGKNLRVAVFCGKEDEEEVAALEPFAYGLSLEQDILAENLDFDVLLAKPSAMPKLAKLGRILGPARLMPSPKSGTVIQDYAAGIADWKQGQLELRPDSYSHMRCSLGKVFFGYNKLLENAQALFQSLADEAPLGADRDEYYRAITMHISGTPAVKINWRGLPKPPKRE